jgi:hypothetical protein
MEQVKQTAVDWLADELSKYDIHNPIFLSNWNILKQLIEQAKEMEKVQNQLWWSKGWQEGHMSTLQENTENFKSE